MSAIRAPRLTETLDESLALRLATAGAVARRELDREFGRRGRPLREVLLLTAARDEPRLALAELARRLGLDRAEVSRVAYELEWEGWLEVRKSDTDTRCHSVQLGAGESIVEASLAVFAAVDRRLRAELSPLRQKQLGICLELLKGPKNPIADVLAGIRPA